MSIRQVQTERLLEDVIRTLHSQGVSPLYGDIAKKLSKYLSTFPAGQPLPMPLRDAVGSGSSDVEEYNRFLANLAVNLDVLYEASLRQIEEIIELSDSLNSQLDRLERHRRRIDGTIDDYLLSMYNTDGYFYSFSDNFSDLMYSDIPLTSAQIDTTAGTVLLPNASKETSLNRLFISNPTIDVSSNNRPLPFDEIYPIAGALEDSLRNTVWGIEARTNNPQEVIARATLSIGRGEGVEVSSVEFTPFGTTPMQVFVEWRGDSIENEEWKSFGDRILTANSKMYFGDEPRKIRDIRFTMRKVDPDYIEDKDGKIYNRYIFGSKAISITRKTYDSSARFVSNPLFVPGELTGDVVIDAISLDVEDEIPKDTNIDYFVAASEGVEEDFALLDWRQIVPVESSDEGDKVVSFNGAVTKTRRISRDPASGDLELIPLKNLGYDSELNPSPTIIPGADIYRIAELEEDVLLNSLELIEGSNTTKIYSKNIDSTVPFSSMDIEHWADALKDDPDLITTDYGDINSGTEFFYGGDVGAIGKDIYVETYLESDTTYPTFLKEFLKVDSRSRTWEVKVFLNGRPLGEMPLGSDSKQLPWSIQQGLNHIVILIRIPEAAVVDNVFLGSLALMSDANLYDFGRVRLATWKYVDFFSLKYNQTGQPKTFSIHDGEIISRRKPTENFVLKYATSTDTAPNSIRFRADLSRSKNSMSVTPQLKSYRIRYSYTER